VATKPELRGHFDPHFADFKIDYPDQLRADEFLREFDGFVRARKANTKAQELPSYVLLRFPNDHTGGTRPGFATPSASVADNVLTGRTRQFSLWKTMRRTAPITWTRTAASRW
jgi:hypothetical protein